jgi:hypothetical protein
VITIWETGGNAVGIFQKASCHTRIKIVFLNDKVKGKAVPLQAWSGPEGCRKLRFPDYMTTAQDGGKVVSLTLLVLICVRG